MKATVLTDNLAQEGLQGEWGLCVHIDTGKNQILLDTGASSLFLENAKKLGVSIEEVEYAVLSHAHYDHADGMEVFFQENAKANFYLREGSGENCYKKLLFFYKYIGLPKGVLKAFENRITYVSNDFQLCEGVSLIPHKTPDLQKIGKKSGMYVKKGNKKVPDDFSHEQSLVVETEQGLVIFNSCSHGGADHIIEEVKATYPDRKITALIGGFHLFDRPEAEVRALAEGIRATGIEEIYTGHCTGKAAYQVLKEELGDKVHLLKTGLVMEF